MDNKYKIQLKEKILETENKIHEKAITNLSDTPLTHHELKILNKGLKPVKGWALNIRVITTNVFRHIK